MNKLNAVTERIAEAEQFLREEAVDAGREPRGLALWAAATQAMLARMAVHAIIHGHLPIMDVREHDGEDA